MIGVNSANSCAGLSRLHPPLDLGGRSGFGGGSGGLLAVSEFRSAGPPSQQQQQNPRPPRRAPAVSPTRRRGGPTARGGLADPESERKALYNSIKNEKLEWAIDDEELRRSLSELVEDHGDRPGGGRDGSGGRLGVGGSGGSRPTPGRLSSSGSNPFLDLVPDPGAATHKQGLLVRKTHADIDGRRTPKGRRGWKAFTAVLRGMVLYLHKGDKGPVGPLTDEELRNAVSIHHGAASMARDYGKRPHVLRLVTADWRVLLLQAPSHEEMESWIFRINVVAAEFSSPPFPAATASTKRFSRPLLPSMATKLPPEEQMRCHADRLAALCTELAQHQEARPDRRSRSKEQHEHRLRETYLLLEKTRYETYLRLLRHKIAAGTDDLAVVEAALGIGQESEQGAAPERRGGSRHRAEQPQQRHPKQRQQQHEEEGQGLEEGHGREQGIAQGQGEGQGEGRELCQSPGTLPQTCSGLSVSEQQQQPQQDYQQQQQQQGEQQQGEQQQGEQLGEQQGEQQGETASGAAGGKGAPRNVSERRSYRQAINGKLRRFNPETCTASQQTTCRPVSSVSTAISWLRAGIVAPRRQLQAAGGHQSQDLLTRLRPCLASEI